LGQLMVNDWKNEDRARQQAVLADLKWWREDFPRLRQAERERLAARDPAPGPQAEPWRPVLEEDVRLRARYQEEIHREMLAQWHEGRQLQIRSLSNLQAKHHETMMLIINNMRPSGRYEYNGASGRYEYVPYR